MESTTAALGTKKVAEVHGVTASKIKRGRVMAAIKEQKLAGTPDLDVAVARLIAHYKATGNEKEGDPKELIECGECKGPSYGEECPYCGASDADTASGTERPSVPSGLSGTSDKPTTALATRTAQAITTAKPLDEAVARVIAAKSKYMGSNWDLGKEVLDIFEKGTWQLRIDPETGKARWKGFDSFCHNELGLVPGQAFELMDIAKKFTRAQLESMGKAKLRLIAQAPEEDQPKLLEKAATSTKREVEAEVRRIKKEKGHTRPNRVTGSVSTGGGRKPKAPEEKITVASLLGKTTVKLFYRPANVKKFDPKELKRAKRFADTPWGREVTENGIVCSYSLVENGAGEWQLVVERSREEPAKAEK